jgi:hypothetical protein
MTLLRNLKQMMESRFNESFEERSIKIALIEANSVFKTNTRYQFNGFPLLVALAAALGLMLVFFAYR